MKERYENEIKKIENQIGNLHNLVRACDCARDYEGVAALIKSIAHYHTYIARIKSAILDIDLDKNTKEIK